MKKRLSLFLLGLVSLIAVSVNAGNYSPSATTEDPVPCYPVPCDTVTNVPCDTTVCAPAPCAPVPCNPAPTPCNPGGC